LQGKICIVTGSNSGIGKETAIALAEKGATVIMLVRNKEKGEAARNEIVENTGNDSIELMLCDLALTSEIKRFAQEFGNKYSRLDVLVNNAGAVFSKREVTEEGLERTLAVNYIAPFILTHELLPILKTSSPSRIINISSGLHKSAKINLDDIQNEHGYKSRKVYGQAKLYVIMYTYELARRLEGTGVTANVLHPGFVATNLGQNSGSTSSKIMFKMMKPFQIRPEEGAETSIYLATSEDLIGVNGAYFHKKEQITSSEISYNQTLQHTLWDKTLELLKSSGIQLSDNA